MRAPCRLCCAVLGKQCVSAPKSHPNHITCCFECSNPQTPSGFPIRSPTRPASSCHVCLKISGHMIMESPSLHCLVFFAEMIPYFFSFDTVAPFLLTCPCTFRLGTLVQTLHRDSFFLVHFRRLCFTKPSISDN